MKLAVAIDGTKPSLEGARHAAALAKLLQCRPVPIHVLAQPGSAPPDEVVQQASVLSPAGDLVSGSLEAGETIALAIIRLAAASYASLVALGTSGLAWRRRVLGRSVAHDLLKSSPTPVLLAGPNVSPPRSGAAPRLLLALYDRSESWAAVARLAPSLTPRGATVEVASIYVPRLGDDGDYRRLTRFEGHLSELRTLLPDAAVEPRALPETTPRGAADAVTGAAAAGEFDLVAIAAPDDASWWGTLARLIANLETPLLVLPPADPPE